MSVEDLLEVLATSIATLQRQVRYSQLPPSELVIIFSDAVFADRYQHLLSFSGRLKLPWHTGSAYDS